MPLRATLLAACLVLALAVAPPVARGGWPWPVRGPVVGRFHVVRDPYAAGQHRGIEIAAPAGTPVRAACGGRVTFAGSVGTSGRTVAVACGELSTTYLHLGSLSVRGGSQVAAGERLGTVGRSGRPRARRPALAFGVRVRARPHGYLDPLTLLERGLAPGAPPIAPRGRRGPRWPGAVAAPASEPYGVRAPQSHRAPAARLPRGTAPDAPSHARPAPGRPPRPASPAPRAHARPAPAGSASGLPFGALWLPAGALMLAAVAAATLMRRARSARRRAAIARRRAERPAGTRLPAPLPREGAG